MKFMKQYYDACILYNLVIIRDEMWHILEFCFIFCFMFGIVTGDENLLAEMSERALKAAKPDASAEIAKHILTLVNLSAVKDNQ